MEVVKITTHDGKEFYTTAIKDMPGFLQELVDRTNNVFQVDILEMTKEEYGQVPVTTEAVQFFGEAPREKEEG